MSEQSYRIGKRKGFTTVYRSAAQDKRLSLKARGLFLLIQSLPDDWKFTVSGMATTAGVGVRQVRAALDELENVGYLVREQTHGDGGNFAGNVWILQEEAPPPLCQNVTTATPKNPPLCQNALTQNASAQNGALQNTNKTNTPLPPKGEQVSVSEKTPKSKSAPKWKPERFEGFWNFYAAHGRSNARAAAAKAWDKLKPDDNTINLIAAALLRQTKADMWRRGVGIPYASTWLNQRRWEDDAPDAAPPDDFIPDDLLEV